MRYTQVEANIFEKKFIAPFFLQEEIRNTTITPELAKVYLTNGTSNLQNSNRSNTVIVKQTVELLDAILSASKPDDSEDVRLNLLTL